MTHAAPGPPLELIIVLQTLWLHWVPLGLSFSPNVFVLTEHSFLPSVCWSRHSPFHFLSEGWDPGEAAMLSLFQCPSHHVTSCSETCGELLLPGLHTSVSWLVSQGSSSQVRSSIIHPSRMLCQPLLCPITLVWLLCLNSLGQLPSALPSPAVPSLHPGLVKPMLQGSPRPISFPLNSSSVTNVSIPTGTLNYTPACTVMVVLWINL